MTFLTSLRLPLARGLVRHGYPWVPTDQAHGRTDKWVWPTRRTVDLSVGPTDLVGGPHDLLKTFQKIPRTTLFSTTSRLGVQDKTSVDYDQSRSTGYGKMCNVDLGLLVITDQESRSLPHPLSNIRRTRRSLVPITQSSSNLHQQLNVGFLLSRGPN
jgi:hypothetical protein